MTNPHGIISVETVNTESIPTLTLADYAFSSSNNAGTADRGKDAKITFNTTTDTFAITVKNNADNSNSNDSMTIKTGVTTFNTDVSMGGSNFVVPSDMSAGTDGQVLKINGSGETYWDDASSSSGTITGVTAGTGLSGGGTTGGVTVNLDAATTSALGGVKVGDNLSIDGNGVLSADNSTLSHNITVDSSNYVFNGLSVDSNPTITLIRGMTYHFNLSVSGHPFHIQKSSGAYASSKSVTEHGSYVSGYLRHSGGDTDEDANGKTSGILTFTVPYDFPDNLYYVCEYHSSMQGTFKLVDGSTVPTATASDFGAIKIGYTAGTRTYPLELTTAGKAYVNVPWTETATQLATPVDIGGVEFDGSADIDLPGVNTTGNQNTTGSAATLTTTRTIAGKNFNGSQNVVIGAGDLSDVTNAGSGAIITTAERTKLNGIAENAEVNVQSDWNAASGDAHILNKPTIPSGNQIIDWTAENAGTIDASNYTNTTYTVGDGGLTQKNFTTTLKSKLDGIEALADVTDATNVLAAGAVMTTGDQTIGGNKTFSNNVIVTGDLTVNGTNTVINSTVLTVNDQHIVINDGGDDTSANGGGIILEGTSANKTILYDNTNTSWDFSEHVNLASGKEFKIADTSVLSATALGSGVVSSSLTSVGTIATGVWQGTAIAHTYIDTGIAENKIVKVSASDVASGEYARFTATGLESVTAAELKTALNISSGSSLWSEGSTSGEIYYTDGNVGIGTNDPRARLEIVRAPTVDTSNGSVAHLSILNSDIENNDRTSIFISNAGANSGTPYNDWGYSISADRGTNTAATKGFVVRRHRGGGAGDDDELLTIRDDGDVGIGNVSAPTARLHIKGANDLSTGNTMDLVNDSGDALFHVQNDGKVGIGTDDPGYNLHVNGEGGTRLKVSNTTSERAIIELMTTNDEANDLFFGQNNNTRWSFSGRDSTEGYKLNIYPRVSGSWQGASMTFLQDGNVGIGNTSPSVKLEVTGDIKSSGTVTATNVVAVSDGSLKTNIQQLENSLDVIQKLKGVSYNWTDPDNHDDEIGLIAQDVEQVVPEVVRNLGNSSLKGIEYQKLTAILIEAVKELSGKLNELNNKVNN